MWNIHYTKGENRKEVALERQSCGMASTLHMSTAWTRASEWNMWKSCGFFLWNLGKHRRWLARRRSQIDHAQESVTSIFSQYWIKLFVKLGRWYSAGLKFLYQRTFNSRINKSFSHTNLFSFRFENYIPAGKTKRKESLIQTFNEMSTAHFFDWLTFAESAHQNYLRCLFF